MKPNKNLCLLLAMAASPLLVSAASDERPNIIFLMTDDQGLKSISALCGDDKIQTPNLDKMVENGVTFENHYATTSISMASRAIVMTGMYEYKTGCNFLHGSLSPEKFEESYPVILRENGYFTGFAGKFGYAVSPEEGNDNCNTYDRLPVNAFDVWGGSTGHAEYQTAKNEYMKQYAKEYPHSTRSYGAFARDFIDAAQDSGKPFCLSISFKAPHAPRIIDPMFKDVYANTEFTPPPSAEYADELLPMQAKLGRQFLTYYGGVMFKDFNKGMQLYSTQVYGVDYAVGMIMDKLRETGLDKNTVVIFTSDNGFTFGEHRMGGKVLAYDSNSRIPMIVIDPRQSANKGKRVEAISANIDIAPTILDYAGIKAPKVMDGKSLKSAVATPDSKIHDNLALINVWGSPGCFSMAVVEDRMKYIYWCFNDGMEPTEELFDLNADPMELNNLSKEADFQKTLKKMRKLYDARLAEWRKNGTDRNDYVPFNTILSRGLDWESRKKLIPQAFWDSYEETVKKQMKYEGDPYDYEELVKHRL
ncbi:MAG: sulfatase-like hydrolase/transferase [Rikenellaceae bacterium]